MDKPESYKIEHLLINIVSFASIEMERQIKVHCYPMLMCMVMTAINTQIS